MKWKLSSDVDSNTAPQCEPKSSTELTKLCLFIVSWSQYICGTGSNFGVRLKMESIAGLWIGKIMSAGLNVLNKAASVKLYWYDHRNLKLFTALPTTPVFWLREKRNMFFMDHQNFKWSRCSFFSFKNEEFSARRRAERAQKFVLLRSFQNICVLLLYLFTLKNH